MTTMKFNTLVKAIEILDLLFQRRDTLTVHEIADSLKMPRSTAYKYLAVLKQHGFLDNVDESGRYMLGFRFLEYASLIETQIPLNSIALQHMRKLSARVKETVGLMIRTDRFACLIERVQYDEGVAVTRRRGVRWPLHCGATAKVLLAFMPDDEIENYLKRTKLVRLAENTITDPEKLRQNLIEIRKRGYAFSDSEVEVGARGVAAPIYNHADNVIASLVVTGPAYRMDEKKISTVKREVIKFAKDISEKIGKRTRS